MPPGAPHHGFIPPFPIRVDEFNTPQDDLMKKDASLFLLSHTHSDHINGLSAKSFGGTIVCSHAAKQMLLKHEPLRERMLKDVDLKGEERDGRTFGHLKKGPLVVGDAVHYGGARDLLKDLGLEKPTTFEFSNTEQVTITLFNANHCPGAVMFLVEGMVDGKPRAVLHTGDFRAEEWFRQWVVWRPHLFRYVSPLSDVNGGPPFKWTADSSGESRSRTLDAIYLDTACLFSETELPSKKEGVDGLLKLVKSIPQTTTFFINAWTWGYEDVLQAIAAEFETKIHVDRYKYDVYKRIGGSLSDIITDDPASTRFHACERFARCEHAPAPSRAFNTDGSTTTTTKNGYPVVYINPVTFGKPKWKEYLDHTESQIRAGLTVDVLLVSLSRHSTLPELRSFVSLFRPKRVIPNTLEPALHGLDGKCVEAMFAGCLSDDQDPDPLFPKSYPISDEREMYFKTFVAGLNHRSAVLELEHDGDAALLNLQGNNAEEIANQWAESGRAQSKLEVMEKYLTGDALSVVHMFQGRAQVPPPPSSPVTPVPAQVQKEMRVVSAMEKARLGERIALCRPPPKARRKNVDPDSDSDSDYDEEARARAMEHVLGHAVGIEVSFEEDSQVQYVRQEILVEEKVVVGLGRVAEAVRTDGERIADEAFDLPTPRSSPIAASASPSIERPYEQKNPNSPNLLTTTSTRQSMVSTSTSRVVPMNSIEDPPGPLPTPVSPPRPRKRKAPSIANSSSNLEAAVQSSFSSSPAERKRPRMDDMDNEDSQNVALLAHSGGPANGDAGGKRHRNDCRDPPTQVTITLSGGSFSEISSTSITSGLSLQHFSSIPSPSASPHSLETEPTVLLCPPSPPARAPPCVVAKKSRRQAQSELFERMKAALPGVTPRVANRRTEPPGTDISGPSFAIRSRGQSLGPSSAFSPGGGPSERAGPVASPGLQNRIASPKSKARSSRQLTANSSWHSVVASDDENVDWGRSARLRERILDDVRNRRQVEIPTLSCVRAGGYEEGWDDE
ncbi:hypothetical protein OF83DRAFT_87503 [Amylostereum chailletii]|nr:hypothetical protein OF83DRAFT_87503 [Amylostereum chailletii]